MKELKITKSYTNRTHSVDAYLKMINKEPLVGAEEEVELAERIHKGDEQAVDKLVRANLRFAFSIAKQYQNRGLDIMDLINEANIGLIMAAKRFDETKGFKFISYAVWWIRQQILFALAEDGNTVRKPLNQLSNINKINKAIAEFEQKNERTPSQSELAEITDIAEDKVLLAINGSQRIKSVDAPFADADDGTLLDVLENDTMPNTDNSLINESLSKDINCALSSLPPREKNILCMFYGIGGQEYSLEEIGVKFHLSRERVRQIKEISLSKIRKNSNIKLLRSYLS